MAKNYNIIRRRVGIVDLLTPKQANIKGYRLTGAANFDGSFATLMTADISSGYLDPAINPVVLHAVNNVNAIRIVFNPDTFTGAAGISDSKHFWLKLVTLDFSGSVVNTSAAGLVITDSEHYGNSRVVISGTAPQGAALANSQQLDLPFTTQDIYIKNEEATGGHNLYIAALAGGGEQQVAPQETLTIFHGPMDTLFIRGSGGTAAFSASFTNYLPL